jgi:hypothetical protein
LEAIEDLRRLDNCYAELERDGYVIFLDATGYIVTKDWEPDPDRPGMLKSTHVVEVKDPNIADKLEKYGWEAFPEL